MIFLDNDDDWILARTRRELAECLLAYLDLEQLDGLLRLAAAALDCSIDDLAFVEE
ncbi:MULTISPECIES: hypothetical protein [Corynebacterium]|uniref:hypothetical protein n=1 Tax=Corynebacterium TaxID=1716 RepID=UPI0002317402|nr:MULTISPECIES: hypothetical protein [Corynebacterium]QJS15359.1 hypothetical protein HK412_03160 [Corynebacterium glutamicum]QXU46652.1 hypothetical protein KW808_05135 [[Brevibacterium] flavum]